jgi:superfamily II DNA helicase RecQ
MPQRIAKNTFDKRSKWHKSRKSGAGHTQATRASLAADLERIPSLKLSDLPKLVSKAATEMNIGYQEDLITACLRRILFEMDPSNPKEPRWHQIRVLRRLIFGKGDTLLIARTGYGKSLIFHAYSVLTDKITLQIIPLNKLGDEQYHDIKKLPGTRPCLLTADNDQDEYSKLKQIESLEFTHILLGPEKASSKKFRALLTNPRFQGSIGLVAIDECHLVYQWGKEFRSNFAMLYELRLLLRRDIVWFGCSATLSPSIQQSVLDQAGFRPLGDNPYEIEVIRTSINRADISLSVSPIPKGKSNSGSYEILYFLLEKALDSITDYPTPQQIPKTIVFVDGRNKVSLIAQYLRNALLSLSSSSGPDISSTPKYSLSGAKEYHINNVIDIFHSHIAQKDKDMRYLEFSQPSSCTRIMVATTSLGMGVNISDVERVVTWDFPLDKEVGDIWQRIGRGGRGPGRTSHAYVFLPYWLFDSEGRDNPDKALPSKGPLSQSNSTKSFRTRNTLPSHRRQSRLSSSFGPEELSDAESIVSIESEEGEDRQETASQETASQETASQEIASLPRVRFWSKEESLKRNNISAVWKDICNGPCKRTGFLVELGELLLPGGEEKIVAEKSKCCNGCNPEINPVLISPPIQPSNITQPGGATVAGFALDLIEEWASEQAEAQSPNPARQFPLPAAVFMLPRLCWQLSYLYGPQSGMAKEWDSLTLENLEAKADLISSWKYRDTYSTLLISYLQKIVPAVERALQDQKDKKVARKQIKDNKSRSTHLSVTSEFNTSEELITYNRKKDDTLAIQVARSEALKSSTRQGIASNISSSTSALLARVRSQVAETDQFLALSTDALIPEDTILVHIAPSQSTAIGQSTAEAAAQSTTKAPSQLTAKAPSTPSKYRKVLGNKDINIKEGVENRGEKNTITWSPTTSSGRKRKITSKGAENFVSL